MIEIPTVVINVIIAVLFIPSAIFAIGWARYNGSYDEYVKSLHLPCPYALYLSTAIFNAIGIAWIIVWVLDNVRLT